MNSANLYNLKIEFEDGHKWDLDILAVNAKWLNCWVEDKHQIKSLSINLLEKDVPFSRYEFLSKRNRESFGAISIKNNLEQNPAKV